MKKKQAGRRHFRDAKIRARWERQEAAVARVMKGLKTYTPEAAARKMANGFDDILGGLIGKHYKFFTDRQMNKLVKVLTSKEARPDERQESRMAEVVRRVIQELADWKRPNDLRRLKGRFRHTGGGTMLVDNARYPSDDTYLDTETGRYYKLRSTVEAHFKMPGGVDSLKKITAMPGVCKKIKEL